MGQDVFLQMSELAFDAVEPRRVGGGELEADVVLLDPRHYLLGFVRREVVQNDPEPPSVLAPHRLEEREELPRALSLFEMPHNCPVRTS